MALVQTEHFHEFLARLQNSADPEFGQPVSMTLTKIRAITDDQTGTVVATTLLPPVTVGWDGLFALTATPDLQAMKLALDAELASRA